MELHPVGISIHYTDVISFMKCIPEEYASYIYLKPQKGGMLDVVHNSLSYSLSQRIDDYCAGVYAGMKGDV